MTDRPRDPWMQLGARTPARIALGRAGAALPTREVLSFALAHAQARDAVYARLDRDWLSARISALGLGAVEVSSEAKDRATYLRRPDLGRLLDAPSRERLAKAKAEDAPVLVLVIGDGLSARAVNAHVPAFLEAFLPLMQRLGVTVGPVVVAEGARVALGDVVGAAMGARLVAVLIGERPGLSAADSLSSYLTYAPQVGRTDAERNCISNIRPDGLAPSAAAGTLAWLIEAALAMRATGIALKDHSGTLDAGAVARLREHPTG